MIKWNIMFYFNLESQCQPRKVQINCFELLFCFQFALQTNDPFDFTLKWKYNQPLNSFNYDKMMQKIFQYVLCLFQKLTSQLKIINVNGKVK